MVQSACRELWRKHYENNPLFCTVLSTKFEEDRVQARCGCRARSLRSSKKRKIDRTQFRSGCKARPVKSSRLSSSKPVVKEVDEDERSYTHLSETLDACAEIAGQSKPPECPKEDVKIQCPDANQNQNQCIGLGGRLGCKARPLRSKHARHKRQSKRMLAILDFLVELC